MMTRSIFSPEGYDSLEEHLLEALTSSDGAAPRVIEELIAQGADPNCRTEDGVPAVVVASQGKYLSTFVKAVAPYRNNSPIDLNAADPEGRTAAFYISDGNTCATLMARGLRFDLRDKQGLSPVEYHIQQYHSLNSVTDRGSFAYNLHAMIGFEWMTNAAREGTLSLESFLARFEEGFDDHPFFQEHPRQGPDNLVRQAFPYFLRCMEENGQYIPKETLFTLYNDLDLHLSHDTTYRIPYHCARAGDALLPEDLGQFPEMLGWGLIGCVSAMGYLVANNQSSITSLPDMVGRAYTAAANHRITLTDYQNGLVQNAIHDALTSAPLLLSSTKLSSLYQGLGKHFDAASVIPNYHQCLTTLQRQERQTAERDTQGRG